jgi:hypothetical protein
MRKGFSEIHYGNGSRYSGDFDNGVRCGKGELTDKNGVNYVGQF